MEQLQLIFLGCGDAFGSGGRAQSCLSVRFDRFHLLIDCGSSSLIAMRQNGIDPCDIGIIPVSNFHGDHAGGLPYFLSEAQLVSKRSCDLTIAGPPGLRKRLRECMEVTFPGSSSMKWRFPLNVKELEPGCRYELGAFQVAAFPGDHPPADPHVHLRIECSQKVIVYSGDTE